MFCLMIKECVNTCKPQLICSAEPTMTPEEIRRHRLKRIMVLQMLRHSLRIYLKRRFVMISIPMSYLNKPDGFTKLREVSPVLF